MSTCPSCGAELRFRSSVSVYAVCASCGSMVVRAGVSVEAIGQMAALPDDISPLQIGTRLVHAGRDYTLLGRVRMAWQDGAWTEWFMDTGAIQGWLTDAQGFLSVSFEQPVPSTIAASPGLGDQITLDDRTYRVADLKQATCIGSEGELPFAAPRGRTAHYTDMVSQSAGFASLEDSDEGRQLYVGENVTFDDLRFDNLRPIDGWTRPRTPMVGDPQLPPPS
jgi:Domain of unknown function (DUF4178)